MRGFHWVLLPLTASACLNRYVLVREEKAELRRLMRVRLRELPSEIRVAGSAAIVRRISEHACWQQAKVVMLYAPIAGEVDIWALAVQAIEKGKVLCLPALDPLTGIYFPCAVRDLALDLRRGAFGILEPVGSSQPTPTPALDFVAVPGLAYDLTGGRLGRGRGHYDRLLTRAGGIHCGVALDQQVLPAIPLEPFDVRMNLIITPTATWHCSSTQLHR